MNWLTLNTTLRAILKTLGAILVALGWTDAAGEAGLSEHGGKLLDAVIALVGSGLWLYGFIAGLIRERLTKRREGTTPA